MYEEKLRVDAVPVLSAPELRVDAVPVLSALELAVHATRPPAFTAATTWCAEAIAQVRDGFSSKPGLRAHPLGLPQMKVSELQSGWLVDALQERFPQAGVSLDLITLAFRHELK